MILIRKARPNDMAAVYELIMRLAQHHNQSVYLKTDLEELIRSGTGANPRFEVFLAEHEGTPVGYASYTLYYSIWAGSHYMNLDDLFVLKEFRGRKIGELLMQALREECLRKGMQSIRWEVERDNHRAIDFYDKLGAQMNIKGIYKWTID